MTYVKKRRLFTKISRDLKLQMMENFFHFAAGLAPLSDLSREALRIAMKKAEFPKAHLLVAPNTVCTHFYFIESGLTRTFYYKGDKDVTDWISTEKSIAVSIISFFTQQPDRRGIELLEPSVIYSLKFEDAEDLCKKHHEIERLFRRIAGLGLLQMQKKFDDVHFATASQRYQMFLASNAPLINRIPLGIVASYLGITQETLSRIRSKCCLR